MFEPVEITPAGIEKILFIAVFLIGVIIFAYELFFYCRLLKKFSPENRTDRIGERIGRLFKFVFAQRRLLDQFLMGIAHFMIFWGLRKLTKSGNYMKPRIIFHEMMGSMNP